MRGPQTDKERILDLEVRLAAAEEELACWRANDRENRAESSVIARRARLRARLMELSPGAGLEIRTQGIELVDILLARSPALCTRGHLAGNVVRGETGDDKIVDVLLSIARKHLAAAGCVAPFTTVWGKGWLVTPDKKAEICALLGVTYD